MTLDKHSMWGFSLLRRPTSKKSKSSHFSELYKHKWVKDLTASGLDHCSERWNFRFWYSFVLTNIFVKYSIFVEYSPSDVLWGFQIFDHPIRFTCLAFIVYSLMYRTINRNRIWIWLTFACILFSITKLSSSVKYFLKTIAKIIINIHLFRGGS